MKLGRLALARGQLDRVAHRRHDTQWLAQAWADPPTRVLVVDDGQALVRVPAPRDPGPRRDDGAGRDGGSRGGGRGGGGGRRGSGGGGGGDRRAAGGRASA